MSEEKVIKRGEVWYIEQPSNNLSAAGMGRPAVVLANDKGCTFAPEIAAVYLTTNTVIAKNRENVKLKSPLRESVAKCGHIPGIPRQWFQKKMCVLTEEEMLEIEEAVAYALAFTQKNDDTAEIRKELEFYKVLYQETLKELAKKQLAEDLAALMKKEEPEPEIVAEPETVAEEPEFEEAPELVDINHCPMSVLNSLHLPYDRVEQVYRLRPYKDEKDFKGRSGLTNMQWALIKSRVFFGEDEPEVEEDVEVAVSLRKEEPKKSKPKKAAGKPKVMRPVNINTANYYELMSKFGLGQKTAVTIIQVRNKLGRFTCMDDIASVPRMGKANMRKIEGHIVFE